MFLVFLLFSPCVWPFEDPGGLKGLHFIFGFAVRERCTAFELSVSKF